MGTQCPAKLVVRQAGYLFAAALFQANLGAISKTREPLAVLRTGVSPASAISSTSGSKGPHVWFAASRNHSLMMLTVNSLRGCGKNKPGSHVGSRSSI